jgi:leader peptidase (prepilin peptidase) / N-methyltransferase
LTDWFLPILAAPFVGSFLGTVIRRLPAGIGIVGGRSRCDHCGKQLGVRDLIPILSWAANRGRCRHCGVTIGWFFPAVEIAAIVVAVAVVSVERGNAIRLWLDCALGWTLLALAWIDGEYFQLPDELTLTLLLAGLGVTAWQTPGDVPSHALAAAVGYLLFRGVGWGYRWLRGRDGLGEGDAKLLAAAGAWLGLSALGPLVLIAAVAALVAASVAAMTGRRVTGVSMIPFGPFLAFAFFALRLV